MIVYPQILGKFLEFTIGKKRMRLLCSLPPFYKFIKLFFIILSLIAFPIALYGVIDQIKDTYGLGEGIGYIMLPLFFVLLPLLLLIVNFIMYMIKPLRRYLNKVHEQNGLPSFLESNKQLIRVQKAMLSILIITILSIYLNIRGFSEQKIGLLTIVLTLISAFFLINSLTKKRLNYRMIFKGLLLVVLVLATFFCLLFIILTTGINVYEYLGGYEKNMTILPTFLSLLSFVLTLWATSFIAKWWYKIMKFKI